MIPDSPFSISLTPEDVHTAAFPNGNYGWGVHVERVPEGWSVTPAAEPQERVAKRQERAERNAKRRKALRKTPPRGSAERMEAAFLAMAPEPEPDLAAPAVLDEVVLSNLGASWKVEGYWNLAGAWRVRGTSDWPFGGVVHPDLASASAAPLVACLPDGSVFAPRIPTFAEAEAHILGLGLRAPPWECGCGQVHHAGGVIVGLRVESHEFLDTFMKTVRLIARMDAHGDPPARRGYREALCEEVLDLRLCTLLDHVEQGGHPTAWWNRTPDIEE